VSDTRHITLLGWAACDATPLLPQVTVWCVGSPHASYTHTHIHRHAHRHTHTQTLFFCSSSASTSVCLCPPPCSLSWIYTSVCAALGDGAGTPGSNGSARGGVPGRQCDDN